MGKKRTTTIELDVKAADALDAFCERGRKKGYVVSRVVEWFVEQDDSVKTLVMGELSHEEVAAVVRSLLQRLGDHDPPKEQRRVGA